VSRKKKPISGGARLIKSGRRAVLIGLTPAQHERISQAAAKDNRPVTQFLVHYGLRAAETLLLETT
jgi:uncharacterized protein (DUF1778 family)